MRAIAAVFLLLGMLAEARAEISIAPLRQVIDEQHREATFVVSNPSRRIVDARVGWVDLAATEQGYERAVDEQRSRLSAAPFLAVSPASLRLEPGGRATVSVALRRGVRPPPGERRSHLLIETRAVRTPLRRVGGSLELDIGLGVSMPVIVRGGRGAATARIDETRLLRTPDGQLELETSVVPGGDFSAYGRIDVLMTPSTKRTATPQLLKRIDNVAAWLDAPRRRVTAPLGVDHLPSGILEIRYIGAAEFSGIEFARRTFELAPPR